MSIELVAKIAVSGIPYALDKPYDYLVPAEFTKLAVPGARVIVPFSRSNRRTEGLILSVSSELSKQRKLKSIIEFLDSEPIMQNEQLKLALWMRSRFFCTVYDAIKAMIPAGLWYKSGKLSIRDKTIKMVELIIPAEDAMVLADTKRRTAPSQAKVLSTLCSVGYVSLNELKEFTGAGMQGIKALERSAYISIAEEIVFRRPQINVLSENAPLPELSFDQLSVFESIWNNITDEKLKIGLLFGVTGSGKTAVYLHLIEKMLKAGKSSILLLPEISLTPQMVQTFYSHFGDIVAILHSSLSAGERYDEWKRIGSGLARIVIGTRSAVFAPASNLGLIIIDEEQEDTYKSENAPRYHARDVANYRCAQSNAALLLGSATPSVESRYFAEIGRYMYFALPERYNCTPLPEVRIVDMKSELRRGNGSPISRELYEELCKNIKANEQSILFLNRRGASKTVVCPQCGFVQSCPSCSVSLTYHSYGNKLMCHYCGYSHRHNSKCPECGGETLQIGVGTQRLEEELKSLFPDIEVLRMDTDTVGYKGGHESVISNFIDNKVPILIGTQMVAKGLNFENVTLVGVIDADQGLYSGNYRASEKTFSLITQVVGRSGRFEKVGRAIIQTFSPENETINQAAGQDYEAFYSSEIELRRLLDLPPYKELITITCTGVNEEHVYKSACTIRDALNANIAQEDKTCRILGPAPLPIFKVSNRFRYRITICQGGKSNIKNLVSGIITELSNDKDFKGIQIFGDINPLD